MRIGGERDRNVECATRGQKFRVRIQLANRLVEPRGRHLHGNAGICNRSHHRPIVERRRARAEDLHEIGMRERIEEPAPRSRRERLEVQPPRFLDPQAVDQTRLSVHAPLPDVVQRPEQVVPGIGREELARLVFAARHVVHLEPELHGQSATARRHDRGNVRLDVVDAALRVVRHRPQRARLPEVVHVLRKPDLVDAGRTGSFDEWVDRRSLVCDPPIPVPKMHVVIDDHSSAAMRPRSPASVILISFGSPSTTLRRPPRASTNEEQSVATATSPLA